MWKDIAFYVVVVLAAVGTCLVLDGRPEPFHAPLSDLVEVGGQAPDLGDDCRRIGQLAAPVTAMVVVYDANAGAAETRTMRVPPGTWLVPESVFDKPY